jgi:hypothetical protein
VERKSRKQRKATYLKRAVLIPASVNFDLEYEQEIARPGTSPPQHAFQLVVVGYDFMVATLGSGNGYPVTGALTRSRAGRATRRRFLWTGLYSSILLANAMLLLMSRMLGELANDGEDKGLLPVDPEYHLAQRRRLEDFYPLPSEHKVYLHDAMAEFRVLDKREPREEVAEGSEWGTGYSRALIEGEDPDGDQRLRLEQVRYGRDYFINKISISAVKLALEFGRRRSLYPLFADKVVDIAAGDDAKARAVRERCLRAWMNGALAYRNYVEMYDAPLLLESLV